MYCVTSDFGSLGFIQYGIKRIQSHFDLQFYELDLHVSCVILEQQKTLSIEHILKLNCNSNETNRCTDLRPKQHLL